jgi:hypothetical protein
MPSNDRPLTSYDTLFSVIVLSFLSTRPVSLETGAVGPANALPRHPPSSPVFQL